MKTTSVNVGFGGVLALAAVAGVAWIIYEFYSHRQLFNPVSDKNLAYSGVNAIGTAVSGNSSWTLGGWVYDITHSDAGAAAKAPVVPVSGWGP